MLTVESTVPLQNAHVVPYVTADEAFRLLQTEFARFMALLETLKIDDWNKPTACTAWNVRDILAHQAGAYAAGVSYKETFRQMRASPKGDGLMEDALNALQLAERAGRTHEELKNELSQVGPVAIRNWAYGFRVAKLFGVPHPVPGWLSIRHLMWVTHSRDTWMHRLDICRATNRPFEQTVEHDARIAELVMLDVARKLSRELRSAGMILDLSGEAGGTWKVGRGEAAACVQMDVLDFNIFASGRYPYEEARARAQITGDTALAEAALKNLLILY